MKKVILIFLFFNIFLTACKKDDESAPSPTTTDILVDGLWQGEEAKSEIVGSSTALTLLGFTDLPTDSTVDLTGATLEFREDGTFTASSLGDILTEEVEGTWELLENDTKIRLEGLNVGIELPDELPGDFNLGFPNIWDIKITDNTQLELSNSATTTIPKEVLEAILPPEALFLAQDLDIVMDLTINYSR